nr:GNAT family N-acetyltransferase [Cryobacterium sp. Y62]
MTPSTPQDLKAVTESLRVADLTLSGLDSPSVQLWTARDTESDRSVAVDPAFRGQGVGLTLARFALDRAAEAGAGAGAGAGRAWLFSRRSGPFWQKVGFVSADSDELAVALASTHQVRLFFSETGQLQREVAWSRLLERR